MQDRFRRRLAAGILMAAILLGGCSGAKSVLEGAEAAGAANAVEEKAAGLAETGMTVPVPEAYEEASDHPGLIVPLYYDTYDYAGGNEKVQKRALVYLPYGYRMNDTETRYNVLYLLHGWQGAPEEFFQGNGGALKNVFDNMMERGDMPKTIIVSASLYNEWSDQGYDASVREVRAFHRDFEDHLMPAVESTYHTYAASGSREDLAASRDHRAFGGFSLGGVTTWLQFCEESDYIRYFLPMSGGCWYYGNTDEFYPEENADFLEKMVEEKNLSERGYLIFAATGTEDSMELQMDGQMEALLRRKPADGTGHVFYYKKEGGVHDYGAAEEYLYNGLRYFFPDDGE